MLPLGAVFAYAGRQLGRVLSLAFSWATTTLFGRVPRKKQLILSVMAIGSLAWPISVLGVLVPSVATFLFAFVTVPDRVVPLVRPAMVALAVLLPAGIGIASRWLTDDATERAPLFSSAGRGYPTALALFVVLVWMLVLAPLAQIRAVLRRWTSAHVAIAVKPGRYDTVVRDLVAALERADVPVRTRRAGWAYEVPGHVLAALGGANVRRFVPPRLVELARPDLEIVVHPMDLAMRGSDRLVSRARAAITRELTFTEAYQTWTREAQWIEDDLARAARGERDLDAVGHRLERATIDYEEWEILYRLFLQVRLRTSPLESDALVPAMEEPPPLGERLRGLRSAIRKLWPARRERRPALGREKRRAA